MARNKNPEETIRSILETSERLFSEKGFEKTSLQDIINESKLSKGAIYHHFVSKDDIFIKICENKGRHTAAILMKIRDDKSLNGREKMKAIFTAAFKNGINRKVIAMQPYLLANPKFLAAQVRDIFDEVAPNYIQPILEQGITDGTIKTNHPKQMAEMIMLLANLWLNPLLLPVTDEDLKPRCEIFVSVMRKIGVDMETTEILAACTDYNDLLHGDK